MIILYIFKCYQYLPPGISRNSNNVQSFSNVNKHFTFSPPKMMIFYISLCNVAGELQNEHFLNVCELLGVPEPPRTCQHLAS